jgi:hypothetical protein
MYINLLLFFGANAVWLLLGASTRAALSTLFTAGGFGGTGTLGGGGGIVGAAGAGLTGGGEARLNLHLVQTLTKSGSDVAQLGQFFIKQSVEDN